jgi:hypothetical protein
MSRHEIDRIVFIIHPFAWRASGADPAKYRSHIDCEAAAAGRWFAGIEEIAGKPGDALVVSAPVWWPSNEIDALMARASDALGERAIVLREQSTDGPLDETTHQHACGRLADRIAAEIERRNLVIDPRTVRAETWGESFEGCAANYGRYLVPLLGFDRPADLRFDHAVPDNEILHGARLIDTAPLARDVVRYRWKAADGRQIVWFHRSRACPGDPPYVVRMPIPGPSTEVRARSTVPPVWPAADSICRVEGDWLVVPIWGIPVHEPVWGKHVLIAAPDEPLDDALAEARVEISGP